MNTLATILIATLAVAAAVSHMRAARYRRERDEARGKASRVWNQCCAARGSAGSAGAAKPATSAPPAAEIIPEIPINDAFGFAVTAEDDPVILPFRRFRAPR